MAMLPNNGYDIHLFEEPKLSPSYTWKLDPNKERVADFVDDLDSVEQATYMMLRTELGKYEVYPDWYGMEVLDLYGKPRGYVEATLPTRIKECLLVDKRINSVDNITIEFVGSQCRCRFTVDCIFGQFESNVDYDFTG